MSPRSHPSVLKRRKELARQERQQEKAQRKQQRKLERQQETLAATPGGQLSPDAPGDQPSTEAPLPATPGPLYRKD